MKPICYFWRELFSIKRMWKLEDVICPGEFLFLFFFFFTTKKSWNLIDTYWSHQRPHGMLPPVSCFTPFIIEIEFRIYSNNFRYFRPSWDCLISKRQASIRRMKIYLFQIDHEKPHGMLPPVSCFTPVIIQIEFRKYSNFNWSRYFKPSWDCLIS